MHDVEEMDARVLELRREGNSFAAIAKTVGLGTVDVYDAFRRALRHQPPNYRALLRGEELRRLDRLRMQLEGDPTLTDAELTKALRAIARLRHLAVRI